jgi:hypothetical protein
MYINVNKFLLFHPQKKHEVTKFLFASDNMISEDIERTGRRGNDGIGSFKLVNNSVMSIGIIMLGDGFLSSRMFPFGGEKNLYLFGTDLTTIHATIKLMCSRKSGR